MFIEQGVCNIKARQSQNLVAGLKFSRSALAYGNCLSIHGQSASATRDVWVVADAADAVKSLLARIEDAEGLDGLNKRLAEVQKDLNNLRKYLDISPKMN